MKSVRWKCNSGRPRSIPHAFFVSRMSHVQTDRPGYYHTIVEHDQIPVIVFVGLDKDRALAAYAPGVVEPFPLNDFCMWAGPIPEPEGQNE